MNDSQPILSVRDLRMHLRSSEGAVRAVDNVSFDVMPGETLGLVGESGSGKSITALSVMGLIAKGNISETSGSIHFAGDDLTARTPREMRAIRGRDIAMIFQEPMTSLNPVMRIGRQISESLVRHKGYSQRAAEADAVELLYKVGIPSPKARVREFPHQLSGGMRQRAMIAMAIACQPKLLIADEPTTALDVTIQAQILQLIDDLKRELNMGVLLITHNFGVVAQTADRTAVMYAGRIVEQAPTIELFEAPGHPYTQGLLAAMPRIGMRAAGGPARLTEIAGIVPRLTEKRHYCSFAPRCKLRFEPCFEAQPASTPMAPDHRVRCYARQDEETDWRTEAAV
jgi:peptide/nickel transport system ATP-binding protein